MSRPWGAQVVKNAETDRSPAKYPVSELRKIESVIVSSHHTKEQLHSVKEQGLHFIRHVRGDGNCFYRAMGFCFLETLATTSANVRIRRKLAYVNRIASPNNKSLT